MHYRAARNKKGGRKENVHDLIPETNSRNLTRKGVLIRLVRVSRMWTFSCWCSRMKRRKISSSAGSEMLRRKRSKYAVVVMTSSTVTCGQRQSEHRWASSWRCDRCLPGSPPPRHSDPIRARTPPPWEHTAELRLKPVASSQARHPMLLPPLHSGRGKQRHKDAVQVFRQLPSSNAVHTPWRFQCVIKGGGVEGNAVLESIYRVCRGNLIRQLSIACFIISHSMDIYWDLLCTYKKPETLRDYIYNLANKII